MGWLNTLNDKLVGLFIGGVLALLYMWRDLSMLKQATRIELDEVKRTADRQLSAVGVLEMRMAAQDVTLARIDENIKTLLSAERKHAD